MDSRRQWPDITHLIVVCCHCIWAGGPTAGADEAEWLTDPIHVGETPTFIEHIRRGVQLLAQDPRAVLVFSGGPTKQSRTKLSESESYLALARSRSWFNLQPSTPAALPLSHRTFIDTFATDSYQNLLCSLLQFPLFASRTQSQDSRESSTSPLASPRYPSKITIITHAFKTDRFLNIHARSLRLPSPAMSVDVCGIDPPMDDIKRPLVEEGERSRGIQPWLQDPYGTGDALVGKRRGRGWTAEREKEFMALVGEGDQRAREFLRWRGGKNGDETFPGKLPWEE